MRPEEQYQQTIQFMYEQLPMFTRVGAAAYKPDLQNTLLLAEKLGNPHLKLKCVHIAGTNGKGSCSSLLATALQKAGYKTGLYTSPHIVDFRERIRINGQEIPKEYVVKFIKNHRELVSEIHPSFFELTVVMAFSYFAEQEVDIAVIEVGLGGLLDSTNIIIPELSVITNISNDHGYLLGNTLQEIAQQKAGIIKPEVPVVIGETQAETERIFSSRAMQLNSPIFFAGVKYHSVAAEIKDQLQYFKIIDKSSMKILTVSTDLMGTYQSKNMITVLNTLEVLKSRGWDLHTINYENVFENTRQVSGLRGRFDIVHQQPDLILDVSHNEAGIQELFSQLQQRNYQRLHVICGFVKDKELAHILQYFPAEATYYFVEAPIPRALPRAELQLMAAERGLTGAVFASMKDALQASMAAALSADGIVVTGSFFILDEAYRYVETNLH
jgi:dihydrofolate synthase/folylpolyglutamate synthase